VPAATPFSLVDSSTGGNLRATMEAVKAEDEAAARKKKG
jgi:hypothetical protein